MLVWVGSGLAVAGLAVALVAWVGLDRANAYLGIPAAVAAVLGLALGVYGLFAPSSSLPSGQLVEDVKVGGNSVVVGRAGGVRIGETLPAADAPEVPRAGGSAGDREAKGPVGPQVLRRTTITGDSTVIGEAQGDVEIQGGS